MQKSNNNLKLLLYDLDGIVRKNGLTETRNELLIALYENAISRMGETEYIRNVTYQSNIKASLTFSDSISFIHNTFYKNLNSLVTEAIMEQENLGSKVVVVDFAFLNILGSYKHIQEKCKVIRERIARREAIKKRSGIKEKSLNILQSTEFYIEYIDQDSSVYSIINTGDDKLFKKADEFYLGVIKK